MGTTEPEIPQGALPTDFLTRVRALPASTIVHTPMALRGKLAACMTATLTGMVHGDVKASLLEEARSKLLYGLIPRHRNLRVEVLKRLELWQLGRFAELLVRSEEQHQARVEARRRQRVGGQARLRVQRALALTRAGAYRKAVASLTSSVAELSPEEQQEWATKLLPRSVRMDEGRLQHDGGVEEDAPVEATSFGGSRKILSGVHFAALSAPGPSGARTEHLQEALGARPRSISSRLARAIAELQTAAAAGTLPESSRWILGSRLVYLKKKKGSAPRSMRIGEFWRRLITKRLLYDVQNQIRPQYLQ